MLDWDKYIRRQMDMIGQIQAMACLGIRTSKEERPPARGWKCYWIYQRRWHRLDRLGWYLEFNCSKAPQRLKCGKTKRSEARLVVFSFRNAWPWICGWLSP
jgi:hypothetical protein